MAGVSVRSKDIESQVGGGAHEVPAFAKIAGFGSDVRALRLAYAEVQPMHANDAGRFPVDRSGARRMFEVGQLTQGAGLDGG